MGRGKIDVKLFNDEIFNFGWMLGFGGDINDYIKEYYKSLGMEAPEDALRSYQPLGHFSAYSPKKRGLIWFASKRPAAATIAHESFHAAFYWMEHMGIEKLDSSTEELIAYYIEWLVTQINVLK